MSISDKVSEAVLSNSFVFLNKAIHELCSHDDSDDNPLEMDTAILSVSLIQIACELILIAYVVKMDGIRSILNTKDCQKTDGEIENLFESNDLQTKIFNVLKSEVQDRHQLFNDDALYRIESFQKIRNKLVHLHCNLYEGDRYDLKHELIYYIVHVIVPVLSHDNDSCFESMAVESSLDKKAFAKLISFPPYVEEMQKLAEQASTDVYKCIHCGHRTFAKELDVCFACNYDYSDQEFANCDRCKKRNSIIFDHLNIEFNHNEARGLCPNCDEDDIIYKCPICEETYAVEASCGIDICYHDHCINC